LLSRKIALGCATVCTVEAGETTLLEKYREFPFILINLQYNGQNGSGMTLACNVVCNLYGVH
jgi:hypothetical protein